ncbi:hypothetical protein A2686_01380 [Candidatus Woesebacteria bacterium RIFCSPHIGHO2_01_FULL_38_10]|uniref:Uncharacterized protein n=1 Tax=Candidatus Woesebacteria bacterium RIFCSPLOWO2_01_FULL_39_10b TaxID=1802517 RepID=A0A1F8B8A2_9BACT|nr:MAG: hypothetical protein A2686_01380 [Candidatus Woesebacteria bacterium RIFCSPHIGHO2_01_FULL_38_10]OGM59929.1 MAG: hypothetical protein A2892_05200 [Candidatus Woesebacteria bacterium RIFCSPLOWO2_01_FULL_39_10b]
MSPEARHFELKLRRKLKKYDVLVTQPLGRGWNQSNIQFYEVLARKEKEFTARRFYPNVGVSSEIYTFRIDDEDPIFSGGFYSGWDDVIPPDKDRLQEKIKRIT